MQKEIKYKLVNVVRLWRLYIISCFFCYNPIDAFSNVYDTTYVLNSLYKVGIDIKKDIERGDVIKENHSYYFVKGSFYNNEYSFSINGRIPLDSLMEIDSLELYTQTDEDANYGSIIKYAIHLRF